MKQLPFPAIFLSVLVGLTACGTTDQPSQSEATIAPQSEQPAASESSDAQPPKISGTEQPETAVTAPATQSEESTGEKPNSALIPDNPDAATTAASNDAATTPTEEDCSSATTQTEMNICAQVSYQKADQQLNEAYQTVKSDLTSSGQQALTSAELAWIEFRDRNCTFAKNQFAGGSIAPLIYNGCLETHTQQRTTELQKPQLPQISYQAADTQLNESYQALLAVLSAPEVEDMTDIQLAWIEYRDRNCAFEVIYGADVIEESQCLARMSEARIVQLEQDIEQRSL